MQFSTYDMFVVVSLAFLGFMLSYVTTYLSKKVAERRGVLDIPNNRSSHQIPTPRGGGIGIFVSIVSCLAVLIALEAISLASWLGFILAALVLSAVGLMDDLKGLGSKQRLAVQLLVAVGLIFFHEDFSVFSLWTLLIIPYFVWSVNLYNFMDGIDGIAAQQAFCFGLGVIVLSGLQSEGGQLLLGVSLAMASLGFLFWNWSPASIFMGDVGSTFLGLFISFLCFDYFATTGKFPFSVLILMTSFNCEATLTLIHRFILKEKVFQAHRSHPYQILSRSWGSHERVSAVYMLINLCLSIPLAVLAELKPASSLWIFLSYSFLFLIFSLFIRLKVKT